MDGVICYNKKEGLALPFDYYCLFNLQRAAFLNLQRAILGFLYHLLHWDASGAP